MGNLFDGFNITCDDMHVWLAPFSQGKPNFIHIRLCENTTISMIRIWNYNKSRVHSTRGVKDLEIYFDDVKIFQGEIMRAPGELFEVF